MKNDKLKQEAYNYAKNVCFAKNKNIRMMLATAYMEGDKRSSRVRKGVNVGFYILVASTVALLVVSLIEYVPK